MNRRGFIGSVLVLGIAPVVVRASSLMRVRNVTLTTYSASFFRTIVFEDVKFGRIWADGELIYPTLADTFAISGARQ